MASGVELVERPGLDRLWAAARRRLEGNGASLVGSPLVVRDVDAVEADAVGGLLARSLRPGEDVRVRLDRLDAALRASAVGLGLVEVVERLGGPLRDRPADRRAASAASASMWDGAASHPAVGARPRLVAWLHRLRQTGLVPRLAPEDPGALLERALAVLGALPAEGRSLAAFAGAETGDAHSLDRGQPVGTLVANALAFLDGAPGEAGDAAAWRERWRRVGVVCDDLSCDVLALNLPVAPGPDGHLGRWLRESAESGEPVRLTLRQLDTASDLVLATPQAFVCENPAVVSAAADRLGPVSAPLVCTAGVPNTAVAALLRKLRAGGAALGVHADFDWGGMRIAGSVIERHGAVPWRLDPIAYAAAVSSSSVPLAGRPAATPWNPALADQMAAAGVAVHEEVVIDALLADLDRSSSAS